MEKEYFFSGYCRQTDGVRTVCALWENEILTEVDCCYVHCPYTDCCTIACAIKDQDEKTS